MKKSLENKFEELYSFLEESMTDENEKLLKDVWSKLRDIESEVNTIHQEQRREIQKKLNEISFLIV